jgi:hypothetical protein
VKEVVKGSVLQVAPEILDGHGGASAPDKIRLTSPCPKAILRWTVPSSPHVSPDLTKPALFAKLVHLEHYGNRDWTASYFRAGTSAGVIGGKKWPIRVVGPQRHVRNVGGGILSLSSSKKLVVYIV